MHAMHSVDANLLVALDALLRTGSVTRAAAATHVSPTAMSHTLARLRTQLRDPLFVRSGNRLVATPRAEAIRDRVARAAAELTALLAPEGPLDVATLERTFTIRMSDATLVVLGPALDELLRREAPRAIVRVVTGVPAGDPQVDLDIGPQAGLAPDLRLQALYHDEMVPVVRARHPVGRRRMRGDALERLDSIVTLPRGEASRGHQPPRGTGAIRVAPSFFASMWLARNSDAVTFVPRRLADASGRVLGLRVVDVDGVRSRFVVAQAWHPRFDRDGAHAWLRRAIKRAADGAR